MRILFNPYDCLAFHGWSLHEKNVGGIEKGIIQLAEALEELGNEVFVMTKFPNPPASKPHYVPMQYLANFDRVDALIAGKSWKGAINSIKTKARLFWTYDLPSNLYTMGIGDPRLIEELDGLLCVSQWQREILCQTSGFPIHKSWVLSPGVDLTYFKNPIERARKRLIYAASPQKGLMHLLPVFNYLKTKHSDLELHIFIDNIPEQQGAPFTILHPPEEMVLRLFRSIPGCYIHYQVVGSQMAKELMRSSLFLFPTLTPEPTSTIILEAQAAGCPVVVFNQGALEEVVGDSGIVIEGNPSSNEGIEQLSQAVDLFLTDDAMYREMVEKALKRRMELDWTNKAKEFLSLIKTIREGK
jgi:glycosyltransferase involved in cell wall biosynthesis